MTRHPAPRTFLDWAMDMVATGLDPAAISPVIQIPLLPTPAGTVIPWLPSPRQAVRTLPDRLDVVIEFGYDRAGHPAALPPVRPLVRITPAHEAHWRSFVRYFGPRCEFALHTAAAGARRTPARCR